MSGPTTMRLKDWTIMSTLNGPSRRSPSSRVLLIVQNITITSHYATHLGKAATRPALLQRFQQHYKWSEHTFEPVDWKVRHGVLQKL
jgi:hypothetical protein